MTGYRVNVDKAGFIEHTRLRGADDWAQMVEREGTAAMLRHVPVDTYGLADSFTARRRPSRNVTVRFWFRASHAIYPEVGTGLYGPAKRYITPRVAQALSWIDSRGGGSKRVFARRIRGQRPQRYILKALLELFGPSRVRYYGENPQPPQP